MSSLSLQTHLVSSQQNLTAISTNPKGFKVAIQSLSDFLVAHQVSATLWVKLPKEDAWWTDIWQYGQQAVGCTIYSLGTQTSSPPENMAASFRPIPIEQDTDLKREYLCMAVAESFVVSLLAVRNPNPADKRTLQLYCTISGQAIAALSTGIKAVIESSQTQALEDKATSVWEEVANGQLLANSRDERAIVGPAALSQWARLFPASILLKATHPLDSAFLTWQLQAQENLRSELSNQVKTGANNALDALAPNFLSQASQELQAPLTTVKTALTLLNSPSIKLSQRQLYLEMIATQCDRQRSLIASVFNLLKVQTAPNAPVQSLKLSDIIPGVVSTYQPLAEERGIMLAHTISPNLPAAMGTASMLKEALIHLIANGIQITPKGGRVWVTAALSNGKTISIKVQDSGTDMSKTDTSRLFDAFHRSREGTGLGLTLAKQLIEKMGGSIEVESQAGQGATFTIQLPISQPMLEDHLEVQLALANPESAAANTSEFDHEDALEASQTTAMDRTAANRAGVLA